MSTTALMPSKKVAMVDGIELKVNDPIEYVPTVKAKKMVRSGIIDKFWMADAKDMKSVWMLVRDLEGGENEVISLKNWKRYLDEGVIKN